MFEDTRRCISIAATCILLVSCGSEGDSRIFGPEPVPTTAPATKASPNILADQILFDSGEAGYHTIRSPTIIRLDSTHYIVFADGRKNSTSDSGNIDIIQKQISFDVQAKSLVIGPLEVIASGNGNTRGNATPLLLKNGPNAGRLLLFYNGNLGTDVNNQFIEGTSKDVRRAYIRYSDDGGKSYSDEKELESARKANWRSLAFGPSQGIQMASGLQPGRLIIPSSYSDEEKIYRNYLLLSDDYGETFYIGAVSAKDSTSEMSLTEFPSGNIYSSMRTGQDAVSGQPAIPTEGRRWIGISTDAGLSFHQEYREEAVRSGSTHGGTITLPENDCGTPLLVQSAPPTKGRTNLTFHLSQDGKSFFYSYEVTSGSSGYSNLENMGRNNLGLFYEFLDADGRFHIKMIVFDISPLCSTD